MTPEVEKKYKDRIAELEKQVYNLQCDVASEKTLKKRIIEKIGCLYSDEAHKTENEQHIFKKREGII